MPTKDAKVATAKQLLRQLDLAKGTKLVTKFSKSVANKILLLVRQGVFYRDAAIALGLDANTAVFWLQDNIEFAREVYKYRHQSIADAQKALWRKAVKGDLQAMLIFLKASDPKNWNIKALDIKDDDDQPDKILFIDRILETNKEK